jgi:hypothetical protein
MASTTPITRLVVDGHPVPIASGELIREQARMATGRPGHTSWTVQAVVTGPARNWPPKVTRVEIEAGGEVLVGRGGVWQEVKATGASLTVQIRIVGSGDLEPQIG